MSHNSDPFSGLPEANTAASTSSAVLSSYSMLDSNPSPSPAFPTPNTPLPLPQLRSLAQFHGLGNPATVTVPHVLCVAEATEDLLLRSGNIPYTVTKQQVNVLSREVDSLRAENRTHCSNYEKLLAKLPQLLGMQPGSDSEHKPDAEHASMSIGTPVTQHIILGLDWSYPALPEKPDGVEFRFWFARDYKERPKKGNGKQGPHDEHINVGQQFLEDEEGNTIPGTVAKDVREVLRGLFHSLVWSGQAALSQDQLTYEARVYIHVMLSRRFPFLLLCDGGTWKINALIKQSYHGFAGHHIKATQVTTKLEPFPDSRDKTTSLWVHPLSNPNQRKRERQGSLAAEPSEGSQAPKVVRLSSTFSSHSNPPLSGTVHNNELASITLTMPVTQSSTPTPAQAHTECDEGNSAMHTTGDAELDCQQPSSAPNSNQTAEIPSTAIPGHGSCTLDDAQALPSSPASITSSRVPVKQPFASLSIQRRSARLTSATSIPTEVSTPTTSAAPSDEVGGPPGPHEHVHSSTPGSPPSIANESAAASVDVASGAGVATVFDLAGLDTSSSGGPSKKRGGKVASIRARSKYRPDVISMQNLFIRQMLVETPEVLYADCLAAYKTLSEEERNRLKNECASERKQKREQQGLSIPENASEE